MDNVFEIGFLLDFYGQLLTARQYEIMDLHYNNDYSLGEIGEQLGISRQGVFDNIKRGKAALIEFENKLGLTARFAEQKKKAEEVLLDLRDICFDNLSQDDKKALGKIETGIKSIIEGI